MISWYKKFIIALLCAFGSLIGLVNGQAFDVLDSIPPEPPKFKFGVHLAASMNYFNYGDIQAYEVVSDYRWGGSFGFSFDWRLSDFYHIRFEPFYEYQQLANEYKDELNSIDVTFTNHATGIDFFPIVFCLGNKVQPEISIGGYFNNILSSNYDTSVNGQSTEGVALEINKMQYGMAFGVGVYLGRKLIEVRLKRSFNEFVVTESLKNNINQVKIVMIL
jgi:hypothetical protein